MFYYSSSLKSLRRAVVKQYYKMTEFVGLQTMYILNFQGMAFNAVVVFFTDTDFLCKSTLNVLYVTQAHK